VKVEQERKFSGKSTTSYKMVIVDFSKLKKEEAAKTYAIDNSTGLQRQHLIRVLGRSRVD
jgi:hypothetical protein